MTKKPTKTGRKQNPQARRNKAGQQERPKRKIGRYVLLAAITLPILIKAFSSVDTERVGELVSNLKIPGFEFSGLEWSKFGGENGDVVKKAKFTNVLIEGALAYSDRVALQKKLVEQLSTDFIRLDLNQIQREILKNEWYRSVAVQRVWPSTLKVTIEEEQPIARWGSSGFINRYGEIVKIENTQALDHLPYLEGRDDQAYEIAKSYLTTSQLLADLQLYITRLSVSEDGDWRVQMNHKFELVLGSKQFSSRVDRFMYLYRQQLGPLVDELAKVDMRYQNGVAIEWKKQALTNTSVSNKIASR